MFRRGRSLARNKTGTYLVTYKQERERKRGQFSSRITWLKLKTSQSLAAATATPSNRFRTSQNSKKEKCERSGRRLEAQLDVSWKINSTRWRRNTRAIRKGKWMTTKDFVGFQNKKSFQEWGGNDLLTENKMHLNNRLRFDGDPVSHVLTRMATRTLGQRKWM
jgi:hypothetical protein